MSNASRLLLRTSNGLGRITLNRPEALNALDLEMMRQFSNTLLEWKLDPCIRAVLIDHSGGRGFCAGGDIRQISHAVNTTEIDLFPAIEFATNVLMKAYPKPLVSLMDGITMGAGLGISMYSSAFISTQASLIAMPEIAIGLYPDIGACWRLPRLAGLAGRMLCLTGMRLQGRDAAAIGVASHYIPPEKMPRIMAALQKGDFSVLDYLPALKREDASFADQLPELEQCFAHEAVEDILLALDRCHAPLAAEAAQRMRAGAPRSVKLAAYLTLKAAETPDFAEHMRLEYRLVRRMLRAPDFTEGVRAVVIDKDNKPKWNPARLQDVSDAEIKALFEPHQDGCELPAVA